MGPFYPVVEPSESAADLTRRPGSTGPARGARIDVTCTVLSPVGKPIRGAIVLIWQANAVGKYAHPRDNSAALLDENFVGHAVMRTDANGTIRFRSVKPGAYADGPGRLRTPHIHYEVIGEEARLITQMYFPDEPLNQTDRLLREAVEKGVDINRLIASRIQPAGGHGGPVAAYEWQLVLDGT